MAVKIRRNFNFKQNLEDARSKSSRKIKKAIVSEILDDYNRGISPVSGTNKFSQYKKSTAKRKGRRSPVTVKESGKLHASLTAVQKGSGTISLFFKGSRNQKIASFLHFGTKFMEARALLPSRGQTFKKRIVDAFNKIIRNELSKSFK